VVIAAITSCTNTSNPTVMVGAGLLAKKAVEAGLDSKPWVKTSMAPGSRVVTQYLDEAGLIGYLEKLRFNLVGFGCTTCIGNSGPLPEEIAKVVEQRDLTVVSVLSGNRNFEGRIHPQVRASYLASPPLVVAYALAGTIDIDLSKYPLGEVDGRPIYLADLWPSQEEVAETIAKAMSPSQYAQEYGRIFEGDERWKEMPAPEGVMYDWNPASTYIQEPSFFEDITVEIPEPTDIEGARVLALLGDSITTDHISPAGSIKVDSPAGKYLTDVLEVEPRDFNTFGARRGNHNVMIRGTFGNILLLNLLAPGTEGGWTTHQPSGDQISIFEASQRYLDAGVPLVVLAGKEYGSGSSRDWAAKGTALLGVRAVIAESFERIHRSNLIGMGVLPLQFSEGDSVETLGLNGRETYTVKGIADGLGPGKHLKVEVEGGEEARSFEVIARIDAPAEVDYYLNGGILQMVLRQILREQS
jgi:aconitate hydratase